MDWCNQHGIKWYGVEAKDCQIGGRGLVATTDLLPQTLLVRVPRSLLMGSSSALRDPELASRVRGRGLDPKQVFIVHLLHEVSKGRCSFWWPYLKTLPRSFTTLMHYSGDSW